MRRIVVAALAGWAHLIAGCSPDPRRHCEERQRFWERSMGEDDPAYVERTRAVFVESCSKMLEAPAAAPELACRQKCLEAARKTDAPGSPAAKDAYAAFSQCETACQ